MNYILDGLDDYIKRIKKIEKMEEKLRIKIIKLILKNKAHEKSNND